MVGALGVVEFSFAPPPPPRVSERQKTRRVLHEKNNNPLDILLKRIGNRLQYSYNHKQQSILTIPAAVFSFCLKGKTAPEAVRQPLHRRCPSNI